MAAEPRDRRISVEAYLALDRQSLDARYEYIDGIPSMMSGGTLNHSMIKVTLVSTLRQALKGTHCRVFDADARVQLSATRFVYPDATITCNPQDRGTDDTIMAPTVVFEVFSPSSETHDRGRKAHYYRACPSIQTYVMLDYQLPWVEMQTRGEDGWALRTYGVGDIVRLTSVAITFAVDEIYEQVEFLPEPLEG